MAKLRAYHYTAQTKPEKRGLQHYGLDLIAGALRNNVEAGVIEPVLAKTKIIQVIMTWKNPSCYYNVSTLVISVNLLHMRRLALPTVLADRAKNAKDVVQFAVEAAITILRIDDMINIAANPEDDMEG